VGPVAPVKLASPPTPFGPVGPVEPGPPGTPLPSPPLQQYIGVVDFFNCLTVNMEV
jgi:hypothetical protein